MDTLIVNNIISNEEANSILEYSLSNLKLKTGRVHTGDKFDVDSHRKSNIAFHSYKEFPFLIKRIKDIIPDEMYVNGFDLDFSNPMFQFTQYKKGDYYDWHTDSNLDELDVNDRFYSIVIQLNENFIGGELDINGIDYIESKTGKLYLFKSNILHRVRKVTKGIRYSLVIWLKLKKNKNYSKSLV